VVPTSIPHRCAILVPALNEESVVADTISQWQRLGFPLVRVIDNASTDNTAAVARAAGADVVHEPRRGYGAAAWTGLQGLPPSIEWVLFSSADGSDALEASELNSWIRAAETGAHLILGDRCSLPDSFAQLNPSQRYCSLVFHYVVQLGWGRRFTDVGSLRALQLSRLSGLNLRDRGFGWNVEMQIRAVECGLKIVELPVRFLPRRGGDSKISGNWKGTLRATYQILRLLHHLWWTRRSRLSTEPVRSTPPDSVSHQ
jgi:glycosyltransferase involved in cell wall biosynthesis